MFTPNFVTDLTIGFIYLNPKRNLIQNEFVGNKSFLFSRVFST